VNVTLCPVIEGLLFEMTVVVVDITFSVCINVDDVLGSKVESPEYCAVMERVPLANQDVDS
jgi:hypothetical protein